MIDLSEFESISPYTDEEAVKALGIVAENPILQEVSQYFFPGEAPDYLQNLLKQVRSIDDFQVMVMSKVVEWVIEHTAHNFSYDGIANIDKDRKFLALSNHRDIIIAVGDNLITNKFIEYLIRSNRMIKVVRGISARELYLSSQLLSKYIRLNITEQKSSIWLAQRQGRTKDGEDITEQGLLKMLDMSGTSDFKRNFEELNIIPLSISYEYEPCDILKARELLISRTQKYVKAPGEDLNSILTGIKQQKGNIHLNIGTPLTSEEIEAASKCDKNDRYQWIRHSVDLRVIDGYKLWKTNYIAYDLLNRSFKYSGMYSPEDASSFVCYMEHQLDTVDKSLCREDLRNIFLAIYSNPVLSKELLAEKVDLPGWKLQWGR